MKLSIIVPIFNERKTLQEVINRVLKQNLGKLKKEVILVNDGSTDKSQKIIDQIKRQYPSLIKVLSYSPNRGKGYALRQGLKSASGEIMLIQDADLEYHPKYYPSLLEPILNNQTQVVYGSRLKTIKFNLFGQDRTPFPFHYLANRFLSTLTNFLFAANLTDMETGYKVFTRRVAKSLNLKSDRFEFEPEITAKILKKGFKIYEVPIRTKPRGYNEGKKITWRDGISAFKTLFYYWFLQGND